MIPKRRNPNLNKVAAYKNNTQRSLTVLYTHDKQSGKKNQGTNLVHTSHKGAGEKT